MTLWYLQMFLSVITDAQSLGKGWLIGRLVDQNVLQVELLVFLSSVIQPPSRADKLVSPLWRQRYFVKSSIEAEKSTENKTSNTFFVSENPRVKLVSKFPLMRWTRENGLIKF